MVQSSLGGPSPKKEGQAEPDTYTTRIHAENADKITLVIVNKSERLIADTLSALESYVGNILEEVLVVDASNGALDDIRLSNEWVKWIEYAQPPGVRTTIAHQRNIGVRRAKGDIIVFTDSGCLPQVGWLERLLAPILEDGEYVTCGPAKAVGKSVYSDQRKSFNKGSDYVSKTATINMAFRREAFEAVGGFDESFGYAGDFDFSWRLTDVGYRLRWVSDAVVTHDFGDAQRQLFRAFFYGKGACHLLRKHPHRIPEAARDNMTPFVYGLFLLGLPLTLKWRRYPLLLLWPIWRLRDEELPSLVLLDHLFMGAGVIYELFRPGL